MSDKSSKNLDKSSKGRAAMAEALVQEAAAALREAFPPRAGENVKSRIATAARVLGVKYRRARALWYAEARRVEVHEWEAIKDARSRTAAERVARLRAHLLATDADFYEPDIAALEQVERRLRGMERAQRRAAEIDGLAAAE